MVAIAADSEDGLAIAADSEAPDFGKGSLEEGVVEDSADGLRPRWPKASATACWAGVFFPGVGARDPPEEVDE